MCFFAGFFVATVGSSVGSRKRAFCRAPWNERGPLTPLVELMSQTKVFEATTHYIHVYTYTDHIHVYGIHTIIFIYT